MQNNEIKKLHKDLRHATEWHIGLQTALKKRKKQAAMDYDFKKHIREKYPEIYLETVNILIQKYSLKNPCTT